MSAVGELSQVRRSAGDRGRRHNKAAFVFLLPWLVGLAVMIVGPMLMSLYLSFTDYNLIQPPSWIGLDNIARMFGDARLLNSLRVSFEYVVVGVPLQLLVALAIALVLDKGMRGLLIKGIATTGLK